MLAKPSMAAPPFSKERWLRERSNGSAYARKRTSRLISLKEISMSSNKGVKPRSPPCPVVTASRRSPDQISRPYGGRSSPYYILYRIVAQE